MTRLPVPVTNCQVLVPGPTDTLRAASLNRSKDNDIPDYSLIIKIVFDVSCFVALVFNLRICQSRGTTIYCNIKL